MGAKDPSRYAKPNLLVQKTVTLKSYSHETSKGKWFLDNSSNWYYMKKNGGIYKYGGGSADTFKGAVNPSKYYSPNNLLN